MRVFAVLAVVSWLPSCTPPGAAVLSCTNHPLTVNDAETCTISVKHFDGSAAAYPTTQSRNQNVHVTGHIEIAVGQVKVEIGGRRGVVKSAMISPGRPMTFEVDVPLNTSKQNFSITLTPVGGAAAGLSGTLDHHAI